KTDLIPALGRNLVKVGRYEDAINVLGGKASDQTDLDLGKACWMTGRKDQAIQAFERVSAARLHKLSAEVALAAITGDIKHWQEAYHAERVEQDYFILARLEDLLPKSNHLVLAFIFRYAGIYEPAIYTKAVEEAQKVLDGDPKNFYALMTIGTAYQRIGRLPEAGRYTQQARDLYPKSGEPASRLASPPLVSPKPDAQTTTFFLAAAAQIETPTP